MVLLHKLRNLDNISDPNIYSDAIISFLEIIERGHGMICKVSTNDNVADPLTKALMQGKHDHHTNSMGIRYMYDLD